jgi:hypothetical protein
VSLLAVIGRLRGALVVLCQGECDCEACAARAAAQAHEAEMVSVTAQEMRRLIDRVEYALGLPGGLVRDATDAHLNLLEWACDLERVSREIDWSVVEKGGWPA